MPSLAASSKKPARKSRFVSFLEYIADWDAAIANRKLGLSAEKRVVDAGQKGVSPVGNIMAGSFRNGRPSADNA